MKAVENTIEKQEATEIRIKNAARKLFIEKGFAATKTRDIAESSGINLALLNYYFRSKRKLYELIMNETMIEFFQSLISCFNDRDTSLEEKIEEIVSRYIDLLIAQPDLPMFIFSALRDQQGGLFDEIGFSDKILNSVFLHQLKDHLQAQGKKEHPQHYFLNMLGMTLFPFVAKPMLSKIGGMGEEQFESLMEDRRKKIPLWVNTLLNN